jgi:succinate dehydrogenase / fumarate reductase membrane anchor subunit
VVVSLRSPLGVVLGRGSAGGGVAHWWAQRLSALALVPLTVWFLVALVRLPLADYAAVTIWIAAGWNPVWLALLLAALCWHSRLGVQVVVEDYVHAPAVKLAALLFNSGAHAVLVAAGAYALLRIALRSMP